MAKRADLFIVILLGILAWNQKLGAQVIVTDTSRIKLDEVTITGARIPVKFGKLSRIAIVVPAKMITSSPARELSDLLRNVPVVDIRSRGPFGIQADLSIRGGSFEQGAVLLNGISLNDPQTGHFILDLPIPVRMLSQIEILPGSDARSMGSGALAGAVNLVSSEPSANEIHGEFSAGRWGLKNIELSGSYKRNNFWNQAGISYQGSAGYRENTDFKKYGGLYQAGCGKGRVKADFTAGLLLKAFGANSFYSLKYPNQYEETASGLSVLNISRSGRLNVRESVFYKAHFDVFHLFRNESPSWYAGPNYHISLIAGSKTDTWFTSRLGTTSLGAEFRHEVISSTVLGSMTETPLQWPFTDSVNLGRRGERNHYSLVLQQNIEKNRLSLSGSLVLHLTDGTGRYFNVYPGFEAGYGLSSGVRIYGSLNRGFRLPSFTELYYKSPTNLGNPDLMPETAWHAETGVKIQSGLFEGNLAGFYRYAGQSIDWVRLPSEEIWHAENLGEISTYGIEGYLRYPGKTANHRKLFVEQAYIGIKYCFQRHSAADYFSLYILDYLKWKISGSATATYNQKWKLTLQAIIQDREGTYTSFSQDGSVTEKEFEPFILIDARLSYQFKFLTLFADCSNLLNQTYFDFGNLPQPGFWYRLGIMMDLSQH